MQLPTRFAIEKVENISMNHTAKAAATNKGACLPSPWGQRSGNHITNPPKGPTHLCLMFHTGPSGGTGQVYAHASAVQTDSPSRTSRPCTVLAWAQRLRPSALGLWCLSAWCPPIVMRVTLERSNFSEELPWLLRVLCLRS